MATSDLVRAALAWLATYGLHSTLFLGGAWALCALRAPRVNRNRERLWKLALVGGFVSATLQVASGARPILGRIDWRPVESARAAPLRPAPLPAFEPAVDPSRSEPALEREEAPRTFQPRLSPSRRTRRSRWTSLAVRGAREPEQPFQPRPSRAHERGRRPALRARRRWTSASPGLLRPGAPGLLSCPRAPRPVLAAGSRAVRASPACFSPDCRRDARRRLLHDGPLVELLEHLRVRAGCDSVRLSIRPASPRSSRPASSGPGVSARGRSGDPQPHAAGGPARARARPHRAVIRRFGLGFVIEKPSSFQPLNRLARRRLGLAEDLRRLGLR